VIRASRAAYLVCGVLTALALAGWGVRAAGTPRNDVARNSSQSAGAVQTNTGDNQDANNGDAVNGNTNTPDDVNGGQQQQAPPVNAVGVQTATLTKKEIAKMGVVLTGDEGKVLYRFDKDADAQGKGSGKSTCLNVDKKLPDGSRDNCAQKWPPLLSKDGQKPQLDGVDENLVGLTKRDDGSMQVMINNWPLYTYIGDTDGTTWKGQKVGGVWWVSDAEGKRNQTCVPKGTPKAVPLPDNGSNQGGTAGGDQSGDNNNQGGGNNGGGYNY
jgi:predicted lipoprotein with Yx(FWY)xxD motif